MDPHGMLYEVDSLETEIKIHKLKLKELTERKNMLIREVTRYMIQHDLKEIEYKSKKFKVVEKKVRSRKKEADIKKDAMSVITKHIDGPDMDTIYNEIKESFKSEAKSVYTIK